MEKKKFIKPEIYSNSIAASFQRACCPTGVIDDPPSAGFEEACQCSEDPFGRSDYNVS